MLRLGLIGCFGRKNNKEEEIMSNIFTEEELKDLGKSFNILAIEALERGDLEKAKYWMQRGEETKEYVHDMYVKWVPRLLKVIHERLGEDQFISVIGGSVSFIDAVVDARDAMLKEKDGLKKWLEFYADVWRQNCGVFDVTEDDEKFTIKHNPCGSGGQMIDRGYFESIFGLGKYKGKGYHTFSQEGMPLYCGHCPYAHMAIPMSKSGSPIWCHDADNPFPRKPGDPCIHYIYKDPKDIPDKFYEMVGMKKPE